MKKLIPLQREHDRAGFDCGDPALNTYLEKMARQHQDKGISRTYVLSDENTPEIIFAYMTLTVCEVETSELPSKLAKKYPQRIPAAKLARLAVSKLHQQKGYGKYLIVEALHKTLNVHQQTGLAGLFVDAKHQDAKDYYLQFGFLAAPEQLDNLFMPIGVIENSLL